MSKENFLSNSEAETQIIAKEIFKRFSNRRLFLLTGDLGSGKTVFVRGIAKYLHIEHKIQSPTFVIEKRYLIADHRQLVHIDLYRAQQDKETLRELLEIIKENNDIFFIEWPETIVEKISQPFVQINIQHADHDKRIISCEDNK